MPNRKSMKQADTQPASVKVKHTAAPPGWPTTQCPANQQVYVPAPLFKDLVNKNAQLERKAGRSEAEVSKFPQSNRRNMYYKGGRFDVFDPRNGGSGMDRMGGGDNYRQPVRVYDMRSLSAALEAAKPGCGEIKRVLTSSAFRPRLPGLTKLVSRLSREGHWQKGLEVFEALPAMGLTPDTTITNAAISACDRGGQWEKALQVFYAMDQHGLCRDTITYSSVISALSKGRQCNMAIEIFNHMMKAGVQPDAVTCCSLIAALDKGGMWQLAEQVFISMYADHPKFKVLLLMMDEDQLPPELHGLWPRTESALSHYKSINGRTHGQAPGMERQFSTPAGGAFSQLETLHEGSVPRSLTPIGGGLGSGRMSPTRNRRNFSRSPPPAARRAMSALGTYGYGAALPGMPTALGQMDVLKGEVDAVAELEKGETTKNVEQVADILSMVSMKQGSGEEEAKKDEPAEKESEAPKEQSPVSVSAPPPIAVPQPAMGHPPPVPRRMSPTGRMSPTTASGRRSPPGFPVRTVTPPPATPPPAGSAPGQAVGAPAPGAAQSKTISPFGNAGTIGDEIFGATSVAVTPPATPPSASVTGYRVEQGYPSETSTTTEIQREMSGMSATPEVQRALSSMTGMTDMQRALSGMSGVPDIQRALSGLPTDMQRALSGVSGMPEMQRAMTGLPYLSVEASEGDVLRSASMSLDAMLTSAPQATAPPAMNAAYSAFQSHAHQPFGASTPSAARSPLASPSNHSPFGRNFYQQTGFASPSMGRAASCPSPGVLLRTTSISNRKTAPNRVCCNALLAAYARANPPQWLKALKLLELMWECGGEVCPDIVSYNTVMKACGNAQELDIAFQVYHNMRMRGLEPSIATFGTLITVASDAQRYDKVIEVWGWLQQSGLELNITCANAFLSALEKEGRWNDALEFFHSILSVSSKVKPNAVTFNIIMSSYQKRGQPEKVVYVFEDMFAAGVEPSIVTYNTLISAYGQMSDWVKAMEVLQHLIQSDNGIAPTLATFNQVQAALSEGALRAVEEEKPKIAECSWRVFQHMVTASGVQPDMVTYNTIITTLQRVGNTQMVRKLINIMNSGIVEGLKPPADADSNLAR